MKLQRSLVFYSACSPTTMNVLTFNRPYCVLIEAIRVDCNLWTISSVEGEFCECIFHSTMYAHFPVCSLRILDPIVSSILTYFTLFHRPYVQSDGSICWFFRWLCNCVLQHTFLCMHFFFSLSSYVFVVSRASSLFRNWFSWCFQNNCAFKCHSSMQQNMQFTDLRPICGFIIRLSVQLCNWRLCVWVFYGWNEIKIRESKLQWSFRSFRILFFVIFLVFLL